MRSLIFCSVLLSALLAAASAQAGKITDLRYSNSPAKTRIVVESDGPITFIQTGKGRELSFQLPESSTVPKRIYPGGDSVRSARLEKEGRKGAKLTVQLRQDRQYKVLRLSQPERLVIDVYRISIISSSQKLAEGVEYTYYQDELNGRQIQAYAVTVAPGAAYEVRPFSAAGTYNGRGLLSRYARQQRLLCAINSSYFDTDGWVIGTTKDRQRLLSADVVPRSALASKDGRPFILKDVAYRAQVRLPDGRVSQIKGMNRSRINEDFVLYNEYFAPSTKTNEWGVEVGVERASGKVLAVSSKGNMAIRPGTYVLSAHGSHRQELAGLKPGDRVELVERLGSLEADGADLVVSGGPLLLEGGRVQVRTAEERIARDIAVGRSPRTAVGVKRDGSLLLLVVDGRNRSSAGLTLQELAQYLQRLGAYEAVNFDGGGSSLMTIKGGKIVNRPSDGRERAVSMGLGLFKKQ